MTDRNTGIDGSQIKNLSIKPEDLKRTGSSPSDGYIPSYHLGTEDFEWVQNISGATNLPDLEDVDFDSGTPTDNQVLTYDTASGKWKAETPVGGYVDKIEEGDSLIEVVDLGTGYIKFQVDNVEQLRLIDGKWYPITDNDIDIGDATHRIKDLYIIGNLSDGSDTATIANIKDAVDKKHTSGSETLGGDLTGTVANALVNVDNFTIKKVSNTLKIADRIEINILLNAFRIAINGSLTQFNMVDGIVDEYEDESGIDTGSSINEDYDSSNDLYSPLIIAELELDYMEYATDNDAQTAYVSSDTEGLDSDTKLLMHMDGADDGTTFSDSSTETNKGNATVSATVLTKTATKKWGTASAQFDGDSGYLSYADSSDWDICASNSDNWTIDLWVKHDDHAEIEYYVNHWESVNERWQLFHKDGDGLTFTFVTGGAPIINTGYAGEITDTNWHHIALCKVGNKYGLYKDGTQVAYTLNSTEIAKTGLLYIGSSATGVYLKGYMDELRIQHSNYFGADPADAFEDGEEPDTITVPGGSYPHLQCHSESTIKQQGSYSLKVIASQTVSLNDTLTNSGLSLDLTDKDELKIDFYAERTGTNLQIQIHDSGGTTSTKDIVISSADTWETTTWDISGISNANKDDIDSIIIKIINADAINTFYVDNFYAPGITNNMTLIANSTVAEAEPDTARIVIFEEDVDSITINTDLKVYVTKDGGSTWELATLTDEGDYESGKRILTATIDLTASGIGSGTNMEYKITTLNNKDLKIHGTGFLWN